MSEVPDLSRTLDELWRFLRGRLEEDEPTIVTLGTLSNGAPQLRSVALRSAERRTSTLEVYTDRLSQKVTEIAAEPNVSLLLVSADRTRQLRLCGQARVLTGDAVRAYWTALGPRQRLHYSHVPAPGLPIGAANDYRQIPAADRLAVLRISLTHIDWVELRDDGDRRAAYSVKDGWMGAWLSP